MILDESLPNFRRKKGGWNRKVCKKRKDSGRFNVLVGGFQHHLFRLISAWNDFCLLSAWTCPSPRLSKFWKNAHGCFIFSGNFLKRSFDIWFVGWYGRNVKNASAIVQKDGSALSGCTLKTIYYLSKLCNNLLSLICLGFWGWKHFDWISLLVTW